MKILKSSFYCWFDDDLFFAHDTKDLVLAYASKWVMICFSLIKISIQLLHVFFFFESDKFLCISFVTHQLNSKIFIRNSCFYLSSSLKLIILIKCSNCCTYVIRSLHRLHIDLGLSISISISRSGFIFSRLFGRRGDIMHLGSRLKPKRLWFVTKKLL